MFKNIIKFEQIIGGRTYHMLCDNDSPLNEVKDSLIKFLNYVNELEASIKAQQAAQSSNTSSAAEDPQKE